MDAETIEVALALRKPDEGAERCEVWEENWPVVELFVGMTTQWYVLAGFGASLYMGIPSQAIEAELRMRRVKNRAQVLDDLRAMERAALPILNNKNDVPDPDTLNS